MSCASRPPLLCPALCYSLATTTSWLPLLPGCYYSLVAHYCLAATTPVQPGQCSSLVAGAQGAAWALLLKCAFGEVRVQPGHCFCNLAASSCSTRVSARVGFAAAVQARGGLQPLRSEGKRGSALVVEARGPLLDGSACARVCP